jgi:hypothetical protein
MDGGAWMTTGRLEKVDAGAGVAVGGSGRWTPGTGIHYSWPGKPIYSFEARCTEPIVLPLQHSSP